MFVERPENKGKMIVDFQLNSSNFYRVPEGRIRIARFEGNFWPHHNIGYYGDIYMKQFIRKWKKITKENIQRNHDKQVAKYLLENKICFDVYNKIIEYI
jgi:hypothetical protein